MKWIISYEDAEFIACWIDATLNELKELRKKPTDFIVSQAFLGREIEDEETAMYGLDESILRLTAIREKINVAYAI